MNQRERKRKAKAFKVAVDATAHMRQWGNNPKLADWQIELAQWQQSKRANQAPHVHPVVQGNQEYWNELEYRQRRYSQGGTHERLKQAAKVKEPIACDQAQRKCFIGWSWHEGKGHR